jgi:hypothetical protein
MSSAAGLADQPAWHHSGFSRVTTGLTPDSDIISTSLSAQTTSAEGRCYAGSVSVTCNRLDAGYRVRRSVLICLAESSEQATDHGDPDRNCADCRGSSHWLNRLGQGHCHRTYLIETPRPPFSRTNGHIASTARGPSSSRFGGSARASTISAKARVSGWPLDPRFREGDKRVMRPIRKSL